MEKGMDKDMEKDVRGATSGDGVVGGDAAEAGMDESDRRLVEALRAGLAEGRYEVGTGDDQPAAPASGQPAASAGATAAPEPAAEADDGLAGEADFLQALNAYRSARQSGDREAMRAAERHLQEVTRAELMEFEASQGNSFSGGTAAHGTASGSCPMPPAF
jgi:hypothetical protein